MNGDPLSSHGPSTLRPKANLLSTYLISDEEDASDESQSAPKQLTIISNPLKSDRLEVLEAAARPSTEIHNFSPSSSVNAFDSTGCEPSLVSDSVPQKSTNLWSDDTVDSCTPLRAQYRVTFEIIRAQTITTTERKGIGIGRNVRYVSYTILMKRVPGLDRQPGIFRRRYSDFLNLYNAIKKNKKYSSVLNLPSFPKKILMGNFCPDVIAARSIAFQNFLSYCLSVSEIRSSKEFAIFLYHPELKEAKRCLDLIHSNSMDAEDSLNSAALAIENVYFIQNKLAIHSNEPTPQLVHTLCCLIGCLNALNNTAEAKELVRSNFGILLKWIANSSLSRASDSSQNNLYGSCNLLMMTMSLMKLCLRLGWVEGKHRISLESKFEELQNFHNLQNLPNLLEIVLNLKSLIIE